MISVALTGGIGCGKTLVSDYFFKLGVPIIDTDIISRQLVAPGSQPLSQIISEFGDVFLEENGQLNRKKLQQHIFHKPEAKKFLENLLHPLILEEVYRQQQLLNAAYCIVVIPLLVESQLNFALDRILLVDCAPENQKQRVLERDGMTESTIEKIIEQQASREQRLAIADDIIVNDADIDHIYRQIDLLHQKYLSLAAQTSK